MTVSFTIPGKPQGKARPRFTKNGHTYTPDTTREYENRVRWEYKRQGGVWFGDVTLKLTITAFYGVPKNFSKGRSNKAIERVVFPKRKPDIDNIVKIIMDALNGVAYKDDAQVCEILAAKRYTAGEPRVLVYVTEV